MGNGELGRAAVFLDRDGVINDLVMNPSTGRMESPLKPGDFRLRDGVLSSLLRLQRAGYPLILVSNQPNYALGKSSLAMLGAIHYRLVSELLGAGIAFTQFFYCLHHPSGVRPRYSGACFCRKPSPWFLLRARDDYGFCLGKSWMVGDQVTDTQCGRAAGAHTIQITSDSSRGLFGGSSPVVNSCADYSVRDLSEAVDRILTFSRS